MGSPSFMRLSLMKGAHAVLSQRGVQEIRGISLVLREMWDSTALHLQFNRPNLKPRGYHNPLHTNFLVALEREIAVFEDSCSCSKQKHRTHDDQDEPARMPQHPRCLTKVSLG
jgi:hypothetical protein